MSRLSKTSLISVVAGLATLAVALLLCHQFDLEANESYRRQIRSDVAKDLSAVRTTAEKAINKRIHLLLGLKGYVSVHPELTSAEFAKFARAMLDEDEGIRSVTLIPNNVIRDVYPREGNEAALGTNLLERDRDAVERAIQSRKPWLSGPVNLVQGGEAFIIRTPVFLTEPDEDEGRRYWGMVSILIKPETVHDEILASVPKGLEIAIGGRSERGVEPIFLGDTATLGADPIPLEIHFPSGSWQLYGAPTTGWPLRPNAMASRLFGAAVCLIASVAVFLALQLVLPKSLGAPRSWIESHLTLNVAVPTVVAFVASLLLFFYASHVEHRRIEIVFNNETEHIFNEVRERFNVYTEIVQSLSGVHSVNVDLDRKSFHDFVGRHLAQYQGIQALEWIPRVPADEREAFEQRVRDVENETFRFKKWTPKSPKTAETSDWTPSPLNWADEYFPVYFVEPILGNKKAFGIDLGSNPVRRAAMDSAGDSGRLVVSERVELAQEFNGEAGVLMFMPVYSRESPTRTVEERRRALRGFSVGVFRVGDIVELALAGNLGGINLQVLDQTLLAPGGPLGKQRSDDEATLFSNIAAASRTRWSDPDKGLNRFYDFAVGGRTWRFRFLAEPEYVAAQRGGQRWLILAGCLSTTGLIGAFMYTLSGRAAGIERLVDERTTELNQEQFLLNSLVESIPDPVFFKDTQRRFIRVNQAMANDAGMENPNDLLGLTDADIWTGDLPAETEQDEIHILKTGEPLINKEERPITPGGEERWVLVTKMALRDESGISGIFGIARDITDRKLLALEVEAARDEAEASSRLKSAFLANTSHEIRTPMNGIIGMADLLSRTPLAAAQREYVDAIQQSADALTNLIDDILDLSKIEAGRMVLESEPFSLADCIGRAIRTVSPQANEKGLELVCRIAPNVPTWLIGDAGRLRQVVINLAGNAVKFTEQGEVAVNVEVFETPTTSQEPTQQTRRIKFTVRDTGIGIATDKLQQIFEAFQQADNSTTRLFGGTGLGLSISSELVQLMNGQISVESELGKGTEFVFTVEFGVADVPDRMSAEVERLKSVRTLVIDDNSTNLRILEELLGHWEIPCLIANDPSDGIKAYEEALASDSPFQMVLLDFNMPKMDGFEVARLLDAKHAEWKDCVVIMLSSSYHAGSNVVPESVGINRCLSKPLISSELLEAILDQFVVDQRPQEGTRPVPLGDRGGDGPLRILLVEDNRTNQLVATGILHNLGHEVMVASNGRQGVDEWKAGDFHVVFMDMHMPVMGGKEAIQEIREAERNTGRRQPIIAMTAEAMVGDRENCLRAGADDYLSKPVTQDRVHRAIERLLRKQAFVSHEDSGLQDASAPPALEAREVDVTAEDQSGNVENGSVTDNCELDTSTVAKTFPDPAALQHLVRVCAEECKDLLSDLKRALEDGDAKVVKRNAHTIKSSARTFGYQPLVDIAYEIEMAGEEGRLDDVPALMPTMNARVESFIGELTKLL